MSELNFLEKLLDGAEVEWKSLWEVTTWDKKFNAVDNYKQPNVIKYHYFLSKEIKSLVVEGGDVKILTTNISNLYTTEDLASDKIAEGEVVGIPWGGNPVVHYYKGKFLTSDNRLATSNDTSYLDNKYLYYFMLSKIELIKSFYRGSGIKHPSMSAVLEMQIPIPPLTVQKEIVRILDAFTALTAELTAELTARKKQYNHYRDQLFTFPNCEMEWRTLRDIGDVKMCKRILKNQTTSEGDIPFYKIGTFGKKPDAYITREIYESYKKRYSFPKKGEVLISASGTIGRTVIYDGEPAYFQDSNIVWLENDETLVTNRYLGHFYKVAKWFVSDGGTIGRLYNDNLYKTKIPVPYPDDPEKSLSEQARIVSILDKFDALTNSISEGLPREIELRQKQYEYYRDLLLNFPKPMEEAV